MDDKLEQIGREMQKAWGRVKKAQTRMWGDWMLIGEGLMEGRRWAMVQAGTNKPEGKGYALAFGEWLVRFKVDDMDKSDRAKILQLMEHRAEVEAWRAGLDDRERRNLNNPTTVWRRWQAHNKPRVKSGISDRTRTLVENEQLQARVWELENAYATAAESEGQVWKRYSHAREVFERVLGAWKKMPPELRREIEEILAEGVPPEASPEAKPEPQPSTEGAS